VNGLQELHAAKVDLFLHQQALDTTTPAGKAMFGMMGVFAEFERSMIVARVNAGMARAKVHGTKSGKAIVFARSWRLVTGQRGLMSNFIRLAAFRLHVTRKRGSARR
jgi:DNA invertase Pin-like site-specific DNA recombinase